MMGAIIFINDSPFYTHMHARTHADTNIWIKSIHQFQWDIDLRIELYDAIMNICIYVYPVIFFLAFCFFFFSSFRRAKNADKMHLTRSTNFCHIWFAREIDILISSVADKFKLTEWLKNNKLNCKNQRRREKKTHTHTPRNGKSPTKDAKKRKLKKKIKSFWQIGYYRIGCMYVCETDEYFGCQNYVLSS